MIPDAGKRRDVGERLVAFLPNMRRFATALSGSRDRGDDLVQEACARALSHADSFEEGTRFDAWVFRILRNLWIDGLRRQRNAGTQEDIAERADLAAPGAECVAESRLMLGSVAHSIAALPPEQREVLVLVCVEEFSYKDAAAALDLPIGTVMSRLSRARLALAEATGIKPASDRSYPEKGAEP